MPTMPFSNQAYSSHHVHSTLRVNPPPPVPPFLLTQKQRTSVQRLSFRHSAQCDITKVHIGFNGLNYNLLLSTWFSVIMQMVKSAFTITAKICMAGPTCSHRNEEEVIQGNVRVTWNINTLITAFIVLILQRLL